MADGTDRDASIAGNPHQPPSHEATSAPSMDDDAEQMSDSGLENGTQGPNGTQTSLPDTGEPMTKGQLKRMRQQQRWEEHKEDRKRKRKEKRHDRQARKRQARSERVAEAEAAGLDPATVLKEDKPARGPQIQVPVAVIIDCDFEEYMRDSELVSLSSQVTRCYSQNKNAPFQLHYLISDWKAKMRTRFETTLANTHKKWRGVHFVEGDFLEAAKLADNLMRGEGGGQITDVIRPRGPPDGEANDPKPVSADGTRPVQIPEPETSTSPSIVYLSSDSPNTLERLEPYTTYIIGGLVDRNRERGLCYKRARDRSIRTAKLPIGDYMVMQSRQVLATNHVLEIMSHWLECGDWGEAFLRVIPKRKGGTLKGQEADDAEGTDDQEATETAEILVGTTGANPATTEAEDAAAQDQPNVTTAL